MLYTTDRAQGHLADGDSKAATPVTEARKESADVETKAGGVSFFLAYVRWHLTPHRRKSLPAPNARRSPTARQRTKLLTPLMPRTLAKTSILLAS